VADSEIIIVIDDDIPYGASIFENLVEAVSARRDAVHAMCNAIITGHQGFAFEKRLLLPLRNVWIPDACRWIDDDLLQYYITSVLQLQVLTTKRDLLWNCSYDRPACWAIPLEDWTHLNSMKRGPIQKSCLKSLRARFEKDDA